MAGASSFRRAFRRIHGSARFRPRVKPSHVRADGEGRALAKPTKDYKQKLDEFIAAVKPPSGEVVAGTPAYPRTKIKQMLAEKGLTVPKPPPITKGMKPTEYRKLAAAYDKEVSTIQAAHFPVTSDNEDYTKLTGLTHTAQVRNWIGGGSLTSCNSFAGKAAAAMGVKAAIGFNIEDTLREAGLIHAWVKPNAGRKPGYGDIFEHDAGAALHVGVSLGFDAAGTWLTIEAGGGGPASSGADRVKRTTRVWGEKPLKGWLSMQRLFGPNPPDWLVGNWTIFCGDKTYAYSFNEWFEVLQSPSGVAWEGGEPKVIIDRGTYSVGAFDEVTIDWKLEGGRETFKYDRMDSFPALMEKMTGKSAKGEELKGVK